MTFTLPFKSYRLSNGQIFTPSHYLPSELLWRSAFPGDEVTRDETIKVLYSFRNDPVTLVGKWSEKQNEWIFDIQGGLTKNGEDTKALIQNMLDASNSQNGKQEQGVG